MYGEEINISTKSPKEVMGDESRGSKVSSSSKAKHVTNGNKCSSDSDLYENLFIKGRTMESIISLRYLEIREGGDKPNMLDKECMEVFTDVNKISIAIGLKTDTIVHTIFIGIVEGAHRTIATSIYLRTTLRGIYVFLVDYWATHNVDAVELCG